jgi:histidinol phosphatase-like PHP family hydrolase
VALGYQKAAAILPEARGAGPSLCRIAPARRRGLLRPQADAFGFLSNAARPPVAGARRVFHHPFRPRDEQLYSLHGARRQHAPFQRHRPGYEVDINRVIEQARKNGCFFEINSSPDRPDLSAENARMAKAAGVLIAINTDAHGTGELPLIRCGIDQARRAGLEKTTVLNCLPWQKLQPLFRR